MQKVAVEAKSLKNSIDLRNGRDPWISNRFSNSACIIVQLGYAKIEQSARIAATEASADGICWTFSPMVDIARDPRWGRIAEGNGEDPYLGYQIAKAMVKGYQGDDLKKITPSWPVSSTTLCMVQLKPVVIITQLI